MVSNFPSPLRRPMNTAVDFESSLRQAALKMHLKVGGTQHAEKIFEKMRRPDAVAWTMFISALIREGKCEEAVLRFRKMQLEGVKADRVTMVTMTSAYGELGDVQQAKQFHGHVYAGGFESDLIIATAMVTMYGKCRSFENAQLMFQRMPSTSVVVWNALITAFAQNGDFGEAALGVFQRMCLEGIKANAVTLVSILNVCTGTLACEGSKVHGYIIESGLTGEIVVDTGLMKMYGNCGNLEAASDIFDTMKYRDVVAWNTMVAACEHVGEHDRALQVFWTMLLEGVRVNMITFETVLRVCGALGDGISTKRIHTLIGESIWCEDEILRGYMADAYLKCGAAREMMDETVNPSVNLWDDRGF